MKFMISFNDILQNGKLRWLFVKHKHNRFERDELVFLYNSWSNEFVSLHRLDKSTHSTRFFDETTRDRSNTSRSCQTEKSTSTIRISVWLKKFIFLERVLLFIDVRKIFVVMSQVHQTVLFHRLLPQTPAILVLVHWKKQLLYKDNLVHWTQQILKLHQVDQYYSFVIWFFFSLQIHLVHHHRLPIIMHSVLHYVSYLPVLCFEIVWNKYLLYMSNRQVDAIFIRNNNKLSIVYTRRHAHHYCFVLIINLSEK